MEAFSSSLALRVDNSPLTKASDVELLLFPPLNKWLGEQPWGWWFETPSRLFWRHRNDVLGSDWYTTEEIWNIWKARSKHLCLICWFSGNGSAPTTNKYCDFNATLKSSSMDEKGYLQCPNIKIHSVIYRTVSFYDTLPKVPSISRLSFITLWIHCHYACIQ